MTPTTILTEPLLAHTNLDRQIALEERAIQDGIARYRRLANQAVDRNDGAALKPAERLLLHWFAPLEHTIREEQKAIVRGDPGVARVSIRDQMLALTSSALALIVMHEVVGSCMRNRVGARLTGLCYDVGAAVFAELHLQQARKERGEILDSVDAGEITREEAWKDIAQRDINQRFRRRTPKQINWWAHKHLSESWRNMKSQVKVGACLIDCLLRSASSRDYMESVFTPAFKRVILPVDDRTIAHIRMTDECHDIIERGHLHRQTLRPRYLPMVVRPYRWVDGAQGGYVSIRTPLISNITPWQKAALAAADLSTIYDGLDAIAGVGVRVNPILAGVAEHLWREGIPLPGVKDTEPLSIPPKPPGFDHTIQGEGDGTRADKARLTNLAWQGVSPEDRKKWKRDAARTHRENIHRDAERESMITTRRMIDTFKDEPEIYYPHKLDHRGRAYAIPQHLNYQGDDVRRAMLEFAEAKDASDPESMDAIRIEAANAWGHGKDKVAYVDRVAWARDHERDIRLSAEDPLANDFWHGAKCPWEFLACCLALNDPERAARLPVGRDGSCNGLQHYAALGRDAEGAAWVNMMPADQPSDVYRRVAHVASETLAGRDDPMAQLLLPMVDRDMVKAPVMTRGGYGATDIGIKRQIRDELRSRDVDDSVIIKASDYLAAVVMKAIEETCVGASAIMEWFRESAAKITKHGDAVAWTSPVGLPVVLPQRSFSIRRVKTAMQILNVRYEDDPEAPVHRKKQRDATPPGVIHSFDASAMMLTAIRCRNEDVSFLGRHDKYATHAATRRQQDHILRDVFIGMHAQPLLANLCEEWRGRFPKAHIAEPPPLGIYDLELLRQNPYFFG